ncbi:Switch 2 [Podosphaera aphanis]|nr:Switch 2 [Podosphaera aphanis]
MSHFIDKGDTKVETEEQAKSSAVDCFIQVENDEIPGLKTESKNSKPPLGKVRYSTIEKRERNEGERAKWSSDEDIYEKFASKKLQKNPVAKKTRERCTITPKKRKANSQEIPSKRKKYEKDAKDNTIEDNDIAGYLCERREQFNLKIQTSENGSLRTPPRYSEVEFSDDESLEKLEERPQFPPTIETSRSYEDIELPESAGVIPASIAQYLRDYQIRGVEFLHELFVYQKGGILGDDMGLGKTVQVIAFLTAAYGKTGDQRDNKRMRKMRRNPENLWYPRTMVICPGSLMENWKQEFARWGWWHVDIFHGSSKPAVHQAALSGRLEVVITTYTTYKMSKNELNIIDWDCVIADECHLFKERTSEITKAMNDVNSLCRIGLTGTAIQNKYEELWTLLNWANPGKIGSFSTWVKSISGPLRIGQSHDATYYQLKRARSTAEKLVNNFLPRFFLRRVKSLIADQLPKKTDRIVFCPLTKTQKTAYGKFLESNIAKTIIKSSEPCNCNSGKKAGWCCHEFLPDTDIKWQVMTFPIIVTLRKLSNHLALTIPSSEDSSEQQKRALKFLQQLAPDDWSTLYASRDSLRHQANTEFCGKWKVLKGLLKYWHENGDKVLIFSNSVKLLRMLEYFFRNTHYNFSNLTGSIAYEDRQKTVNNFNSSPHEFVFLISTRAGGVGLNITSANKVVIFDPSWNPSYDLQAQDRAYRIGQTRDVEVYRLVSAGTIEEIIYARQIYKQQQANIGYNASTERRYFKGVQNDKGRKGEIFGLQNLLKFHADNIILRGIVNQTNIAEAKRGFDILDVNIDDLGTDANDPIKMDADADDDGAMSCLEALLAEEGENPELAKNTKPKIDAIQAILASAGVAYTSENSEIVGSSRVEAELSRRAQETGNDMHYSEVMPFSETQASPGNRRYVFKPPQDVMLRQFCCMAKEFGYASAQEFALVVESWTQNQRTEFLGRFYLRRKEILAQRGDDKEKTINLRPNDIDREILVERKDKEGKTIIQLLDDTNHETNEDAGDEIQAEKEDEERKTIIQVLDDTEYEINDETDDDDDDEL